MLPGTLVTLPGLTLHRKSNKGLATFHLLQTIPILIWYIYPVQDLEDKLTCRILPILPRDSCSFFCKAAESKWFLLCMTKEQWRIGKPERNTEVDEFRPWLSTAN